MNNCKKEKNEPITVYVRVRPLSKQELLQGNTNALQISEKEIHIKSISAERYQKSFSFDKVFGPYSKQIEVFKTVAQPAVAEIIAGYNCTIFAYGQTGTGKTYTMTGDDCGLSPFSSEAGIIPRTLAYLFDELRIQNLEYTVRVSYLELYNEEIFDLLSPPEDNIKLKLFDDSSKKGSVVVQGLTEISVMNVCEVYNLLLKGSEKRRTASTLINAQSSRSHTIFCVTVHTKETNSIGEDLLKTGKLNLVDLAGSENVSKSGVVEKRVREACNINQSLLTLGRCIIALTEHRSHIPYRESKLTRLLKDSLGGRTKTSLVGTLSPAFCNLDETFNTLDYASRAKHITNKPEINQCLTKKALLKEYGEEIERLRKDLQATRLCNGIYLDKDNYEDMLKELEIQKEEINDKISHIRVLTEERMNIEKLCTELHFTIKKKDLEIEKRNKQIKVLDTKLEDISLKFSNLKNEVEAKEFLIDKRIEYENILTSTAGNLLDVAELMSSDTEKLHSKLLALEEVNKQNKVVCEHYALEFNSKINELQCKLCNFDNIQDFFFSSMRKQIFDINSQNKEMHEVMNDLVNNLPLFIEILMMFRHNNEIDVNHFKSFINDFKSDFGQMVDENKLDIHHFKQNDFFLYLENIYSVINRQFSKMENTYESIKDILIKMYEINIISVKKFKSELSEAKEYFSNKLDDVTRNISRISLTNLEHILDEHLFEQQTRKQTEIITQAAEMLQNILSRKLESNKIKSKSLIDTCLDMTNYINECEETINSTTERIATNLDVIANRSGESNAKIFRIINDELNENYISNSTFNDSHENFKVLTNNILDGFEEKYELQRIKREGCINDFFDSFCKDNSENSSYIDKLKNTLIVQFGQEQEVVKYIDFNFNTFCNSLYKKIDYNKTIITQHGTNISNELERLHEDMKNLISVHLKEYKKTGSTPVMQRYKYSKTIPASKTNDMILEEYYEKKIRSIGVIDNKENILPIKIKCARSSSVENYVEEQEKRGKILHLKNALLFNKSL